MSAASLTKNVSAGLLRQGGAVSRFQGFPVCKRQLFSAVKRQSPSTPGSAIVRAAISAETPSAVPQRVVPDTLPKVYVYDHCPFCVRVRVALGYKNVKHQLVFMANDDVHTPTGLIGKKLAPILECPDDGTVMNESLDIVQFFDKNEKYGPTDAIAPMSERTDIKAWMKSTQSLLRLLHRPRYMKAPLPEFQQQDSLDYFVSGHQLPPFEKAAWKEELDMATKWEKYEEAMARTPELLPELNQKLKELDGLIHCEHYCTEGIGFSYDDVDLWARLRSLTLVKGADFGPKTRAYLDNLSKRCDVPLYDCMAM